MKILLLLLFSTIFDQEVVHSVSFDEFCPDGRTTAGPSLNTYTANAEVSVTFDLLASDPMLSSLGTCLVLDELVDQYGANDVAKHLVALDLNVFYGGGTCGTCLQLRHGNQSMIVTVFEWHNGRGTHDLGVPLVVSQELQQQQEEEEQTAINYYLPFPIEWSFVPCEANDNDSANLLYRFSDDATLENTPSLKLTNVPYGIQSVQMQRHGLWYELERMVGNSAYWVLPQGKQVLPMTIRVQSFTNEVLEFVIDDLDGSSVLKDSGVQFTGTCVRSSTTTSSTTIITAPPSQNRNEEDSANNSGSTNNGGDTTVEASVPASSIYNTHGSSAPSLILGHISASCFATIAVTIFWLL